MTTEGFSLQALVAHVASELRNVHKYRSSSEDSVLEFSSCELEIAVTVGSEASGGLKVWIVGADYKGTANSVSRVKLSFQKAPGSVIQASHVDETDVGPENPKKVPPDEGGSR